MSEIVNHPSFFIALQEKLKNNDRIKNKFGDRILLIDDPSDPTLDGKLTQRPFIGIMDDSATPDLMSSGQFEYNIRARLYVFQQRFNSNQERIVGADGILALFQLVYEEMCVDSSRNDFSNTSYFGAEIVEAVYAGQSGYELLRSDAHPNLLRKAIFIDYQTVQSVEIV